jgi:hypothetical protein
MIYCLAEAPELDVYFNGARIQVNIPPGVCDYTEVKPYYYFSAPAGNGATSYTWTINADGSCGSSACAASCIYDYTASGGQNCCEGNWAATVTTHSASGPDVISTTTGSYGGKIANCLQGAGVSSQFPKLTNGAPSNLIWMTSITGMSQAILADPPINTTVPSIVKVANFWNPNNHSTTFASYGLDFPKTYTGTSTAGTLKGPNAFNYVLGSTSGYVVPHPFYEVDCYNTAQEIKARIRLMIRGWDQNTGTNIQAGGNPDYGGVETDPSLCQKEQDGNCIKDYDNWNSLSNRSGGDGYPRE